MKKKIAVLVILVVLLPALTMGCTAPTPHAEVMHQNIKGEIPMVTVEEDGHRKVITGVLKCVRFKAPNDEIIFYNTENKETKELVGRAEQFRWKLGALQKVTIGPKVFGFPRCVEKVEIINDF